MGNKKIYRKKIYIILIAVFFIIFFDPSIVSAQNKFFTYNLMESVPFIGQAGESISLSKLIVGIYRLLIWSTVIASLFMLSVGGFYHMISAGNPSVKSTAWKIVTDALIGLFVAMVSWGLLYLINPELVQGQGVANPKLFKDQKAPITPTQPPSPTTPERKPVPTIGPLPEPSSATSDIGLTSSGGPTYTPPDLTPKNADGSPLGCEPNMPCPQPLLSGANSDSAK